MDEAQLATKINKKDQTHYTKLWARVCKDLIAHYGEDAYKSWFSKINFFEAQGPSVFVISAPSNFIRDWIKSNYFDTISGLLMHHDPDIISVDLITVESKKDEKVDLERTERDDLVDSSYYLDNQDNSLMALDPRFTFENFVVGKPNELAYAAALSVAESDKAVTKSNPLFLYGGVGLGKTHLMHAIAWHTRKKNPNRKVLYMSAEKFMYRFIKALRNKNVMAFKEEFRSVDILMVDDIQFLCGKESTQEEFFHTFNAIVDNNKQMVISCDRSPTDLDNVEDRIKSRLGWGLVADVHSTTYELRVGILESKLEKMGVKISQHVVDFLASKITSNVRELEGALNKVIAHSTLVGREVTLESTQDILRDLLRSNERVITVEEIQRKVANRYNIKMADMSSSVRLRSVARPRQIAMYLAKNMTSKSLSDIGAKFGKKDHTTVIHAIKKVEELIKKDPEIYEEIDLLTKILQN